MHLRNVELFCEVVSRSSFSKAAKARQMSQSAASQAVQALEDRLGAVLIDRSQRPLSLTPAGQIYFDGCRRLLDTFRQVEEQVFAINDRVTGRLRVAAIYSVGLLQMSETVVRYREGYPEVSLQLDYLHPEEVAERVRAGDADLGIVSFPRGGGDFTVVPWLEQSMTIAVPPDHHLASRNGSSGPASVDLIDGEPFVGFCGDLRVRRRIDRWLKSAGVSVDVVHEFDNCEHIKRAVEVGSGVAILPEPTLRRELEQGTLVSLSLDAPDWKRPLGFIHRRNRQLTTAAERFIERLLESTHGQ
ncbi:MAG: LysR family transcriptional regulator [Planctomycetota bacterium]|nr:LysR family transcriptional regulator [Planctomycetota bacterium]